MAPRGPLERSTPERSSGLPQASQPAAVGPRKKMVSSDATETRVLREAEIL